MLILKIILITSLGLIFYQDLKERLVYWFLFPILGICSAVLFHNSTLPELFYVSIGMNLMFIAILMAVLFLYAKLKLRSDLDKVFGLGDMLMFICIAFSFSTISFIVIFVFSLFFALVLHLIVKQRTQLQTVPLAGYISLFFGIAHITQWTGVTTSLYAL